MAVFTGLQPSSTGIYKDEPYWSSAERPETYFEAIRKNHYYLYGAGKIFHGRYDYAGAQQRGLSHADWLDQGNRSSLWDEFQPMQAERLPAPFPSHQLGQDNEGKPWSAQFDWGVLPTDAETQHADVITAGAIARFLKRPPKQPFICVAGFYKPHLPWYAPQRWFNHYPLDKLVMPIIQANDLDDVPAIAKRWAILPGDHSTLEAAQLTKQAVQAYKASISFADEQIGRVLKALWQSPEANNTIVALWSDNGFHLGEKLHWRKFTLWEEATRVPLIIASPQGGPYQKRVEDPVSVVDLFPTLFDLAGLPALPHVDGHSLKSLMLTNTHKPQKPALMTWGEGNHSIRVRYWRYTRYHDGSEELYNLQNDPQEHNNLATQPAQLSQLHKLRAALNNATRGDPVRSWRRSPSEP
jgi:arylsulfatase A-like enzyme